MGRFDLKTRSGQISAIIQTQSATSTDGDAQAYFDRVTAAGGTLTDIEKSAVNALAIALKANGTWTLMQAIYPMVGASAAACSQNLKSSSFTGTFTSGWTFASTGATPNGTSAYMDTYFLPQTNGQLNNVHISYYSRTQSTAGGIEIGTTQGPAINELYMGYAAFPGAYVAVYSGGLSVTALPTTTKMFIASRLSSSQVKVFYAGSLYQTIASNSQALTTYSIYLAALHSGANSYYSGKQCAFASIGEGLTDTQAVNFSSAVQAFQTTFK